MTTEIQTNISLDKNKFFNFVRQKISDTGNKISEPELLLRAGKLSFTPEELKNFLSGEIPEDIDSKAIVRAILLQDENLNSMFWAMQGLRQEKKDAAVIDIESTELTKADIFKPEIIEKIFGLSLLNCSEKTQAIRKLFKRFTEKQKDEILKIVKKVPAGSHILNHEDLQADLMSAVLHNSWTALQNDYLKRFIIPQDTITQQKFNSAILNTSPDLIILCDELEGFFSELDEAKKKDVDFEEKKQRVKQTVNNFLTTTETLRTESVAPLTHDLEIKLVESEPAREMVASSPEVIQNQTFPEMLYTPRYVKKATKSTAEDTPLISIIAGALATVAGFFWGKTSEENKWLPYSISGFGLMAFGTGIFNKFFAKEG